MGSRTLQPLFWDPSKGVFVALQPHGGEKRVSSTAAPAAPSGGLSDGDYGDITVSGSGTVMNIDANAVGSAEIAASAVDTSELADDAVTDAKLRESAARSVIGRAANSTGNPADIAGGGADTVLTDSGTALAFTTFAALVLAGLLTAALDPGYGDGTDGAVTYSGNTTLTEEVNASSINIDASVTVIAPYPVRCRGTLSFDATSSIIHNSGTDAVGSGAAGGLQGYGSGYAGAAGANGRVTTANGIAGSSRTASVVPMIGTSTSGNGGAGGASSGNSASAGGTCTQINTTSGRGHSRPVIEYCVPPTGSSGMFGGAGGGGGALTLGAGSGASGNGGGGGGVCIVWAHVIDCSAAVGVVRAKGGNGSNSTAAGGASGGGGGGGGGGVAILVYASAPSGLPTHTAQGGTKGTGSGAGGLDGSNGVDGVAWAVVVP